MWIGMVTTERRTAGGRFARAEIRPGGRLHRRPGNADVHTLFLGFTERVDRRAAL